MPILIRDIPIILIANFFLAAFLGDLRRYKCFSMTLSKCAVFSFRQVRGKRERWGVHPFAFPSTTLRLGRKWRHRYRVFLFHYPSSVRRHPLNHLLNPRPSALSPPRSRLMAFENSNIIRRSISFPLRTASLGDCRISRSLLWPLSLSFSKKKVPPQMP